MKTTSVTIEGQTGRSATISRDSRETRVVIASLHFETIWLNPNADSSEVWDVAMKVQQALDGFFGTGTDVREYSNAILAFMN